MNGITVLAELKIVPGNQIVQVCNFFSVDYYRLAKAPLISGMTRNTVYSSDLLFLS